jgi:dTDP-4-dehydrorhamnose 3,5-epimerase
MKLTPLGLAGAYLLEPTRFEDGRGFFAVGWNEEEFQQAGLEGHFVQMNSAYNFKRGTVRGLHAQRAPHEETKLVRVVSGAIYDVIVDIRPDSPTCGQWKSMELSVENRRTVYIPPGFLHGYQTLSDDAEVLYLVSDYFAPHAALGAKYDDPAFAIAWPLPVTEISEKDQGWPAFERAVCRLSN